MAVKIRVGERDLRAKFYHSHRDENEARKFVFEWEQAASQAKEQRQIREYDGLVANQDVFNGLTVCEIVDGNKVLARGFAFCSSKDQFNRKVGRKISLGRALQGLERSGR